MKQFLLLAFVASVYSVSIEIPEKCAPCMKNKECERDTGFVPKYELVDGKLVTKCENKNYPPGTKFEDRVGFCYVECPQGFKPHDTLVTRCVRNEAAPLPKC